MTDPHLHLGGQVEDVLCTTSAHVPGVLLSESSWIWRSSRMAELTLIGNFVAWIQTYQI